ncbi:MAG: hypothetical protein JOY71_01540 [Acetobacteraceae bacterium]|nr:hypothetical protein [Acetobacteraceae bacterium]
MPFDGNPAGIQRQNRERAQQAADLLSFIRRRFVTYQWRWIQVEMSDGKNGFCLLGGVLEAAKECPETTDILLAYIVKAIRKKGLKFGGVGRQPLIAHYNDAHNFVDMMEILAKAQRLAAKDAR